MSKPKKPAPQEGANALLEALKEAESQHQAKLKRDKRDKKNSGKYLWLKDVPSRIRAGIILVVIILVVLIADGVRREAGEMQASIAVLSGQVTVRKAGAGGTLPGKSGQQLTNKDMVITGNGSTATVVFSDGSTIQLEENTTFEVRLLDFARGGRRDRSFLVRAGSVVARFSRFFGVSAGSEGTVCTPTAVAAVRGTGFRVSYDPTKRQTYLAVVEGQVRFRTATTESQHGEGQMTSATGYELGRGQALSNSAQNRIQGQVAAADRFVKPPSFLQNLEYGLNAFLDPGLQLIGISPGSWSYAAGSAARRAATRKALLDLRAAIEAMPGDTRPDYINPLTLEELQIEEKLRVAILDTFSGNMLESYQRQGTDDYSLIVRSRDRNRTRLRLTSSSLGEVAQ